MHRMQLVQAYWIWSTLVLAPFLPTQEFGGKARGSATETPVVLAQQGDSPAARLIAVMRVSLRQQKPSANSVKSKTGDSLFSGSYDWHSNLFAHWCLLTHARRTADKDLAKSILEPLTAMALAEERGRLAKVNYERSGTYPYDQCWLVLLLAELERHREVAASTRAFRVEVEARILDWLENSAFPEIPAKRAKGALAGRKIVGWYRSWAWTWYQLRRSNPVGDGVLDRLLKLHAAKLEPNVDQMLAETKSSKFEFLDVPMLAFVIGDVQPFDRELPLPEIDQQRPLPGSVTLRDTHTLGTWISRLWPLAIAARTDAKAREVLDAEIARYMQRTELWDGDFQVISHWIPQFLWFTLWLAEPR
ncbi:MAG: hypothetical protein ACI89X_003412 [Planctomycetota bacterium]|jgi:hypothetical protein